MRFRRGAGGITVSTLKEAEQFFAAGYRDILYAVGIAPNKLDHVAALRARGTEVIVVSSGAVGLGMGRLGLKKRPAELAKKQACAAVGQSRGCFPPSAISARAER